MPDLPFFILIGKANRLKHGQSFRQKELYIAGPVPLFAYSYQLPNEEISPIWPIVTAVGRYNQCPSITSSAPQLSLTLFKLSPASTRRISTNTATNKALALF